jgi:hypothetical protein
MANLQQLRDATSVDARQCSCPSIAELRWVPSETLAFRAKRRMLAGRRRHGQSPVRQQPERQVEPAMGQPCFRAKPHGGELGDGRDKCHLTATLTDN